MTTKTLPWKIVNINDVTSVYKGRNEACCCGCSGTHTTTEENPKKVQRIVNKIEELLVAGHVDIVTKQYVSAVEGKHVYIAYFI